MRSSNLFMSEEGLERIFGSPQFASMAMKMAELMASGSLPKIDVQFSKEEECGCPNCRRVFEDEFRTRLDAALKTRKLLDFMKIRRDGFGEVLSKSFLDAEIASQITYAPIHRDSRDHELIQTLLLLLAAPRSEDTVHFELKLRELGLKDWKPEYTYNCAFQGTDAALDSFRPVFKELTTWWLTDQTVTEQDFQLLGSQLSFLASKHKLTLVLPMHILRWMMTLGQKWGVNESEALGWMFKHMMTRPSEDLGNVMKPLYGLKGRMKAGKVKTSEVEEDLVVVARVCEHVNDKTRFKKYISILWASLEPMGELREEVATLCFNIKKMSRATLLDEIKKTFKKLGKKLIDDVASHLPYPDGEESLGLIATRPELTALWDVIKALLNEPIKDALGYKAKIVRGVEKTGVIIVDVEKLLTILKRSIKPYEEFPSPLAEDLFRWSFAELAGNKAETHEAEVAVKNALKAKAEAEAEERAKAKADEEAKLKAEAEAAAAAKAEAKAKAKAEAEAKAIAEAEVKAKADAEAKALADAKAKAEAKADEEAAKRQAEAEAVAAVAAAVAAEAEAAARLERQTEASSDDSKHPAAAPSSRAPAFIPGLVAEFIDTSGCKYGAIPREAAISELSDQILANMLQENIVFKNVLLFEKLIACILKTKTKMKPAVCEAVASLALTFAISDPDELHKRSTAAHEVLYYNSTTKTVSHTAAAPLASPAPVPSQQSSASKPLLVSKPKSTSAPPKPLLHAPTIVAAQPVLTTTPSAPAKVHKVIAEPGLFTGSPRDFRRWRYETLRKISPSMMSTTSGVDVVVDALAEPLKSTIRGFAASLNQHNKQLLAVLVFLSEEYKGGPSGNKDLQRWEGSALYKELEFVADGIKNTRDKEIALACLWWESASFDDFMSRFAALGGSL